MDNINNYNFKEVFFANVSKQYENGLHKHEFFEFELQYINDGRCEHIMNGKKSIIEKGCFFIVDCGVYHGYKNKFNEPVEIINCRFTPEAIDRALHGCKSFKELVNHYLIKFNQQTFCDDPANYVYHDDDKDTVGAIVHKLLEEFNEKRPGYIESMRCCLIYIIIEMMRRHCPSGHYLQYSDSVNFVLNYVDENYMKPISLSDIADILHVSLTRLSVKFKKEVKMNFKEYLQKKRIENACRLLVNTEKSVDEIMRTTGYSDPKFFRNIFKAYTGLNPLQFKKGMRSTMPESEDLQYT